MANTTNFGWETPDDTDLVKDGALAMRTLGNAIDTSLVDLKGGTTGQVLSKNTNTDMDFVWTTPQTGDITEVTAGTGLSGGGTSGAVTLTNTVATTFDAKGDLVVGTGADTFAKLTVGTNGHTLVADSSTGTGLKWAAPAAAFKGCLAQNTAEPTLSNDTFTAIGFTIEQYDTDAFHSTVTNTSRMTIPAGLGGYYLCYGALRFASNAAVARRGAAVYKNGSQLSSGLGIVNVLGGNANITASVQVIINLAAGDYVELFGFQDSGGNLALAANGNYFGIQYLGA